MLKSRLYATKWLAGTAMGFLLAHASAAWAYTPPTGFNLRELSLPATDLAYDTSTSTLWASVASRAGLGLGNSLTAIDPFSGTLGSSYFIGSEPTAISLSSNGQYAYAALDGSNAVNRFNLATKSVDLTIPLGVDGFLGPRFAEDIAVMPGSPTTIAVSMKNLGFSPRHMGVAVFDGSVARPVTTASHTGGNRIAFSDDPQLLYGYNNETTEFGLRTMLVTDLGLSIVKSTPNLVTGFNTDFKIDGGLIYSNTGRVIRPQDDLIVGTYVSSACGSFSCFSQVVEPFTSQGITYMATRDFFGGTTLQVFDQDTFVPLASYSLDGVDGDIRSMTRWGNQGLALLTNANEVILLTPVPEPATSLMWLLGLFCLVLAAKRRVH